MEDKETPIELNEVLNEVEPTASEISSDAIENFDFSSEKEFDIDQSFELINFLKKKEKTDEQKELIKLQEAKNIIAEAGKYVDQNFVDDFNKKEENLINLIKRYDPNKEIVKNMTETEKDKIYEIAQYLFNEYQKGLNVLTFNFPLSTKEHKFIMDTFRKELEYDQNEVFQLKELKSNYLDQEFEMNKIEGKVVGFKTSINVNDLIVFYHLFAKLKVKGIDSDFYNFVEILTKIADRIKLFNAYNVVIQRLSNDFQMWGGALSLDNPITGEVLEAKVDEAVVDDVETEKIK